MPRGPYKRYLNDPSIPIPERTLRRRRQQENEAQAVDHGNGVENPPSPHPDDIDMDHEQDDNRSVGQDSNSHFINSAHSSVSGRTFNGSSTASHAGSSPGSDNSDSDNSDSDNSDSDNSDSYNSSDSDTSSEFSDHLDEPEMMLLENGELQNAEAHPIRNILYEGCRITLEESELLLMSYALRFGLSDTALEHLLEIIDLHLPFKVHGSLHMFKQKFPSLPTVITHYYCPKTQCRQLLKFTGDGDLECECSDDVYGEAELKQQGYFFLQIPLKEQLQSLLSDRDLYKELRWESEDQISDVLSGRVYKDLVARHIISKPDISLQWNTDGVQVFKSNKIQLWPLQVAINNLPYRSRKENIILCGLWFGPKKPNMNTYLEPFVNELRSLHTEGIECDIPELNKNVKVHTLLCSVDSQARPVLQNIKTFRGQQGCSFCLHTGEEWAVGRGRARVYRGDTDALRTKAQHVRDVNRFVERNEKRNGIKGASILLLLPIFNIIDSFVPEYMHCVLLGCVKTMFNWWTSGSNKDKSFYLGSSSKKEGIDEYLLSIKPPTELTRVPHSVTNIANWKASEWKNFLLYYSSPVLLAVGMPALYIKHWFLLVYSMTIFLNEHISEVNFGKAESALRKFVLKVESVYDAPELLKFNFHLLLHIPKSVRDFGALWAVSAFPYEHYNGVLADMFQGTHSVPQQICKSYLRSLALKERIPIVFHQNSDENAKHLLEKLTYHKSSSHLAIKYGEMLRLLGLPSNVVLNLVQKTAIRATIRTEDIDFDTVLSFQRFILKGILFHVNGYERMSKRLNNVVQLKDRSFLSITHILISTIICTRRKFCVILGEKLLTTGAILCEDRDLRIRSDDDCACVIVQKTDECVAVTPRLLARKCILMSHPIHDEEFCCVPLVNSVERD